MTPTKSNLTLALTPRRPALDSQPDGMLESDHDYVMNNIDSAVFLLDREMKSTERMTMQEAAKQALACQDGVNLSGILRTFTNVVFNTLWPEARRLEKGTDFVNTHPITKVFLDKLCDLAEIHDRVYVSPRDMNEVKRLANTPDSPKEELMHVMCQFPFFPVSGKNGQCDKPAVKMLRVTADVAAMLDMVRYDLGKDLPACAVHVAGLGPLGPTVREITEEDRA